MSHRNRQRKTDRRSSGVALQDVSTLRDHPCAVLVPPLTAAEAAALAADIRAHGVLKPLEINAAGVVLDGRERLRAARMLGLEALPARVVAPADERSYILREALLRKHLNPGQRALLALELHDGEEERAEASARQRANLKQYAEVATSPPRGKTRDRLAEVSGVGARTVQDVATVKRYDAELVEQIRRGEIDAAPAARTVRNRLRNETLPPPGPLPAGPFDLIYADPPWQLGNPASAKAPENHYPTMRLEAILALKPPAAEDALLYLWAVNMLLREALAVIEAWGFSYVANLVWLKPSIGLGFWTRNRHELLLVGRRGRARPPEPEDRPDSVLQVGRGHHSQKPGLVYELLERAYPHARKLELFARSQRAGWSAWGNEAP